MNNLQIFKNKKFGEMRTVEINNIPFVCLADVCKILEIKNISDCKGRLKQDGVVTNEVIDNLGRKQQATFINESNLYKVIFQSRKPEAEEFTEWVTNEVLPSIRKNGGYIAGQETLSDDELIQKALLVATNKLKEREKQLEEQRPKVLFANSVETSATSILIGDLAKLIKQNGHDIGQNRLFKWLRENGYLIKSGERRNMPTQMSMDLGLFEVKERTVNNPDGSIRITKTTKVSGKGQVYFVNKFLKEVS
ncbi:MAG: phage antirepressor [Clostridium sp.]|jgi:phage antirepressor YoqD-like protein|nr:phage antirepressor [Clostridium sp.]